METIFFQSRAAKLAVHRIDPRIHFALNCGAISCPAIAYYNAEILDQQLQEAEKKFVEEEFKVDLDNQKIICSKLFRLYKNDFPVKYLSDKRYKGFKVKYKPYYFSVV